MCKELREVDCKLCGGYGGWETIDDEGNEVWQECWECCGHGVVILCPFCEGEGWYYETDLQGVAYPVNCTYCYAEGYFTKCNPPNISDLITPPNKNTPGI